jgi:hypothetical protein
MALPTKSDIQTMSYSKDGTPWVQVSPKTAVDLNTMSYSKDGTPWWGVASSSGSSSLIKVFNGLVYASTKTVNGLAIASMKTFNGLT